MMRTIWICVFLLTISCSSQDPEKQGPPGHSGQIDKPSGNAVAGVSNAGLSYSLEITTSNATRGSLFYAVSKNIDLSKMQLEWIINGALADAVGIQYRASEVKRGDIVQARATGPNLNILSNSIEIKNSLPELSAVKIMPEVFKPGDNTLYIDVSGHDPDDDPVSIVYEWAVNGQPAGRGHRISSPIKRGDKVSVKITPFDETDYGNPVVLDREILNMPPVIQEHSEFAFEGDTYKYQVKASDPDGDALTYSLLSAQPGMSINAVTGLITWPVPADFKGKKKILIKVDDNHDGSVQYSLGITIN